MALTIADLTNTTSITNGVSNGTGALDKILNTLNLYLQDQYDSGRLKGTDYAQVLLGGIQSALAQAVQYKNVEAQVALYDRQRTGFDDDAKQKLIKTAMDSWAVMFSSAPDGDLIPDTITRQNIDKMMENAMIALGMNETVTNTFGTVAANDTLDGVYLETPITVQG
jgi:hypothetical protein